MVTWEMYGLYCACKKCTSRIRYVGQTSVTVDVRFRDHLKNARRDKNHRIGGLPVYRWIRKHGVENIRYRVLGRVFSQETADKLEVDLIHEHSTFKSQHGLNTTPGGGGVRGYNLSDKSRAAISAAKKGKPGWSKAGLTEDQVADIKHRLWCGVTIAEIAESEGLTKRTVGAISRGQTWRWVPWPIGPRQQMRTRERLQSRMENISRDDWGRIPSDKTREIHPNAKLTPETVRVIRERYTGAYGEVRSLAQEFGVSEGSVSAMLTGRTWKSVK